MNTQKEWLWLHIDEIRATLTSCEQCDSEGMTRCPHCLNMAHCDQCGGSILLDGSCANCNFGKAVNTCQHCEHGKPTCPKCGGDGWMIGEYTLDNKRGDTLAELWREFHPIKNRIGEIVRLCPALDGYRVIIDRNHKEDDHVGTLTLNGNTWTFNGLGLSLSGHDDSLYLDKARNAIFEAYTAQEVEYDVP